MAIDHQCSAYCRGRKHAEPLFIKDGYDPAEEARNVCEQHGVRFVAAEYAPEAKPPLEVIAYGTSDRRVIYLSATPEGFTPYLVIWEETDGDDRSGHGDPV